MLRRKFLKEHRRITYTNLLTSGRLSRHLAEIQQTAQRRMEQMVAQMAKENGVTEELKERDQMKWGMHDEQPSEREPRKWCWRN